MKTLASLKILPAPKPGSNMLQLSGQFKKNFRLALTGGGDHMSFGVPCEKDPTNTVTVEMLDSGQGAPKITSSGFQFLLTSSHAQLWTLLLQYLSITDVSRLEAESSSSKNRSKLETEQDRNIKMEYSTELFSQTDHSVLNDLIDYGLVYKRHENRIYPTRLATTLTSASPITTSSSAISQTQTGTVTNPSSAAVTAGGGFIILETNYRIYAYTENPLQIAILNLFVSLRGRFTNLVTGSITRES
ncbi:RNA polymerase II transcription factor B 52 kDa subunit, partial [Tulasnella sp. 427]